MEQDPNMYDVDPHVAEVYDQSEDYHDDVTLLLRLIAGRGPWRILEPFCGTGRILIPLARAGHAVVGLDQARGMLARAEAKAGVLGAGVQSRILLRRSDVLREEWPAGLDLVVLGGNCLYELGWPEEQERCIAPASRSLQPGGYLFLDNNHMEGELDPTWIVAGPRPAFPTGTCADGTRIESIAEVIWHNRVQRLIRYQRCTRVAVPSQPVREHSYVRQTHPVSTVEVRGWLAAYGFRVEDLFGDRQGNAYSVASGRAIFWAVKQ